MSICLDGYTYRDICISDFIPSSDDGNRTTELPTLTACAAAAIVKSETLTKHALNDLPQAFAPALLLAALEQGESSSGSSGGKRFIIPQSAFHIFRKWPQDTLRFESLLPSFKRNKHYECVEEGFSILAFGGLFSRPSTHRVRCLDLTGYLLDQSHMKDMFEVYPYILLSPDQKTYPAISAALHSSPDFQVMKNVKFKQKLEDLLQRKIKMWQTEGFDDIDEVHQPYRLGAPRLEIIFDKVELKVHKHAQSQFQLDLALASCLRHYTPIHFSINKMVIRGSCFASKFPHPSFEKSSVGQDVLEAISCLPKQRIEGICLQWLPLHLLKKSTKIGLHFPKVKRLSVKESMVRAEDHPSSRSSDHIYRSLAEMIHSFKCLNRLELFSLNLQDKLGMLLCSISCQLEFLSLEASTMHDQDLLQLATSCQLDSLRELNLRDICRFLYHSHSQVAELLPTSAGDLPPCDEALLAVVRNLQCSNNLMVLNISKNLLTDSCYMELCQLICSFRVLRCLIACDIMTSFDLCVEMIKSCVEVETLEGMVISCKDIYQHDLGLNARGYHTWDNLNTIASELRRNSGREMLRIAIPRGRLYDIYATHHLPGIGDWL